jgi:hypothetical protein
VRIPSRCHFALERFLRLCALLVLSACGKAANPPPPLATSLGPALPAATGEENAPANASAPALPAPSIPAPAAPRLDYQQADIDPENDLLVAPPAPIDDCSGHLERAGVRFELAELPLTQKRGKLFTCGAEQVVTYLEGPGQIRYNGAPLLTCRMALALARFEQIAQQEAERHLQQRITRFTHVGTYSCRKMARFDFVSEHSYANAIDIQTITLASGKRLSVEKNFGALNAPPQDSASLFLRTTANRAFDEEVFSVVLTPFWDKLHRDHFHLDLARYRVDGSRQ